MSAELQDMFLAMRGLATRGEPGVLATVVRVAGSAYRSLGARMLILPDGRRIGSVSGGCIEGEIAKKGWWWTEGGKAYVRRYDTAMEGDGDGYGLACNGAIEVLLERVHPICPGHFFSPLEMLERIHQKRVNSVLATVFKVLCDGETRLLGRFAMDKCAISDGELHGETLLAVLPHMRAAMADRMSSRVSIEVSKSREVGGSRREVLLEFVEPPLQLVICGAGFDAVPLVKFAAQLGWRVVVCDGRADLAKAEKFPEAERVFALASVGELRIVKHDDRTACVIMTHSYEQDKALLSYWLQQGLPYLGILGARLRTHDMLDELGAVGAASVYAPAGLDIGSETPEEIALSIVAEIRACFANRRGGSLRDRSGSIHLRHGNCVPDLRQVQDAEDSPAGTSLGRSN